MGISYIINNNDSLLTGQTIFGDLNITGGTITINGNPIGGGGFLYGTFTNCVGGIDSFGGNGGTLEAKLYRCQLTSGTFETPTGSGKIVLGIDGSDTIIDLP